MQNYARIQVSLSSDEWKMLKSVAAEECREPRQQARYMLKQLLEQKNEGTGSLAKVAPVPSMDQSAH